MFKSKEYEMHFINWKFQGDEDLQFSLNFDFNDELMYLIINDHDHDHDHVNDYLSVIHKYTFIIFRFSIKYIILIYT